MKCKKACLVINPRAGQNLAKLNDVMAVLSAAGWKTDIAIKEYGGHSMELATRAAEKNYDLVIVYGGDGTMNQVVNGVMNAKGQQSIVGLIPGGTANVWAGEIGIPADPVKAALTLVNSECRKVDIGHVEVESLTFPGTVQGDQQHTGDQKTHTRKVKPTSKARHHFLLMDGLGIDAAIMGHVSKPLKFKVGPVAVGVSAAKELPEQQPFPIEIRSSSGGRNGEMLWKGEALQVVVGNTRRYANVAEMTPDAYIDDGVLDVCVITAGNPLTTVQQLASLLLRHKPDNTTAEYFRGAHFVVSVPASIDMQLDGSAVKLKDYLSKSDRTALRQVDDAQQIMVNYRFDAMPRAFRVAIPNTYDDALFEDSTSKGIAHDASEQQQEPRTQNSQQSPEEQEQALEQVNLLADHGRKVQVVGVAPNPEKKDTYIVAGTTTKRSTGETRPVAVCIDSNTTMIKRTGEHLPPGIARELQEGGSIVVEGKQSKRGVIRAKRVVVV